MLYTLCIIAVGVDGNHMSGMTPAFGEIINVRTVHPSSGPSLDSVESFRSKKSVVLTAPSVPNQEAHEMPCHNAPGFSMSLDHLGAGLTGAKYKTARYGSARRVQVV
jgi:hypothetical protein